MKGIKPLSEGVHSSLRSSIILFDLTRVVEELVYNSLDAGARKVSVYIGISTCCVKVVDDGSGITRDGLVLLGERYATSKLQNFDDMNATSRSFGFRGEALGSISDISLLEIVTKAHGRPNGFRKVMKGCSCLYLGIDDDRRDVGTTVIVRDLFYNQPVRRKQMQSSPKKVLHSVEKCILRIALVHSVVSFEVIDVESEEELLHIHPSSPLSLLMSFFGIEISSFLHEINLSDGELKFFGYVSGPCNTSSVEAFQYVYINSRFIHRGPIHKLLNQLASTFNCVDMWKSKTRAQNVKRHRSQASPTYILNLSCPRSWYDLAFEPLKTSVEFKDWVPILNFIEKAIKHIWSENTAHVGSINLAADKLKRDETWTEGGNVVPLQVFLDADYLAKSEIPKSISNIKNHQDLLDIPTDAMELPTEDSDYISHWKDNKISSEKMLQDTADLKHQPTEMEFVHQSDTSFQFKDIYLAKCTPIAKQESDYHRLTPDNKFFPEKDDCSITNFSAIERSNGYCKDNILGSMWGIQCPEVNVSTTNALRGSRLACDFVEFGNEVEGFNKFLKKPFLLSCSSKGLPTDEAMFLRENRLDWKKEGFGTKRKWLDPDCRVDVVVAGDSDERFTSLPSTLWKDEVTSARPSSRIITNFDMPADLDFLESAPLWSSPFDGHCFPGKNDIFSPATVAQIGTFSLDNMTNFKSNCATSDLLYGFRTWDVEDFTCRGARFGGFAHPERETGRFRKAENVGDIFTSRHCDILADDGDWLCFDACGAVNTESLVSHNILQSMYLGKDGNEKGQLRFQNSVPKEKVRRSLSAPPFYRGKKRFLASSNHWPMKAAKRSANVILAETSELEHPQQSSGTCPFLKSSFALDSSTLARPDMMKMANITADVNEIHKVEKLDEPHCLHGCYIDSDKDFTFESNRDLVNSEVKRRYGIPPTANGDKAQSIHDHCNILDISSGILHFAADSLVPESINKDCLEETKVLQQVDKKFIPVVASAKLAIIDQHAADERIRLEELRRKVLSGEMKTLTYLDAEQELVLPETLYQLMHNYTQQIQSWGWICNNHSRSSSSFTKNLNLRHKQPTVIKLVAVPCILGVNLSDVDLLEFLQQLADTDGSSTMPPSVVRVLNLKACRGAIMFGDALLLSECSLIVEELKQTSLCLQCAHGRPTIAPLVNLEALHKQLAELGIINGDSNEPWHGLRRHPPNLERAMQRLITAKGHV